MLQTLDFAALSILWYYLRDRQHSVSCTSDLLACVPITRRSLEIRVGWWRKQRRESSAAIFYFDTSLCRLQIISKRYWTFHGFPTFIQYSQLLFHNRQETTRNLSSRPAGVSKAGHFTSRRYLTVIVRCVGHFRDTCRFTHIETFKPTLYQLLPPDLTFHPRSP